MVLRNKIRKYIYWKLLQTVKHVQLSYKYENLIRML